MSARPSIETILSFSFSKIKPILLPFDLKRWLKILLVVWLAGYGSGFSGFQIPSREAIQKQIRAANQDDNTPADGSPQTETSDPEESPSAAADDRKITFGSQLALALLLVPLLLFIAAVFVWLAARFNFILLDLLIARDVKLGALFSARRPLGNAYFRWLIGFMLAAIAFFALLIGAAIPFGSGLRAALLIIALIGVLGFVVIGALVRDFAVPIMYQDQISTLEACRKFIDCGPTAGSIFLYLLLKLGLGIVSALALGIVWLVLGLIAAVAAMVVALPGILLAKAFSFLGPVLAGAGILLVIVGGILLALAGGLLSLPIPIFFRAFSLTYLMRFAPRYNLLNFPLVSEQD